MGNLLNIKNNIQSPYIYNVPATHFVHFYCNKK